MPRGPYRSNMLPVIECEKCGHTFQHSLTVTEMPSDACPECAQRKDD